MSKPKPMTDPTPAHANACFRCAGLNNRHRPGCPEAFRVPHAPSLPCLIVIQSGDVVDRIIQDLLTRS